MLGVFCLIKNIMHKPKLRIYRDIRVYYICLGSYTQYYNTLGRGCIGKNQVKGALFNIQGANYLFIDGKSSPFNNLTVGYLKSQSCVLYYSLYVLMPTCLTRTSNNIYADNSVINAADSILSRLKQFFKLMLTIL